MNNKELKVFAGKAYRNYLDCIVLDKDELN